MPAHVGDRQVRLRPGFIGLGLRHNPLCACLHLYRLQPLAVAPHRVPDRCYHAGCDLDEVCGAKSELASLVSGGCAGAGEFGLSAKVHGPIRLHPAPRRQARAAEAPDPQEHLAPFFFRREERWARPARLSEIHPAEEHCRAWAGKIAPLSGGEKRRVALCRLPLSKPDILLLDEPTNHLDAESVEWLEQFLRRFPGTVVAVTHDRYFLDNAAQWILELDRGYGIPWEGNYSSWLEQKEMRLEVEEKQEQARIKSMQKELEWVRQNPKGRQAKSKARLARFEELSSYEYQKRNETQEIFIPVADRLGDSVIEFKGVSKGYGERLLIDDLSFSVPPGAIVGIIGPNGAGKSTLFRMITGKEKADRGRIVVGPTVKMAHVDQSREALEADKTVWEFISAGADTLTVGKFEMPSRAYLGRFNIKGADQQKKLGTLSGGERGRVHLAKTMLAGGNVLLLDEPSNDLDVETLRALEDALLEFAGCVLVISHDRWFLDRIATHILAFEGDSRTSFFAGNYQEYESDKSEEHTSELQSQSNLVCRLLLEKKKKNR